MKSIVTSAFVFVKFKLKNDKCKQMCRTGQNMLSK